MIEETVVLMLVFNFVVYTLLTAVVSWGFRFAGFGNEFHNDFLSIESLDNLRGFSAIMVLLNHTMYEKQVDYFENRYIVTVWDVFILMPVVMESDRFTIVFI